MKKTPLYNWHKAHGANMLEFSGWSMPLWYTAGAVAEHQIVIAGAGVFDTSHMSAIMINGPEAFDLLQRCFTKDLNACVSKSKTPLVPGRCVYGAYLNEMGEVLDDAIVYQVAQGNYTTIVNAGMGATVSQHLKAHAAGLEVDVTDLTDKVGKMDIQGPLSARVLMKVLKSPEATLKDMAYFSFKGHFDEKSVAANTFVHGTIPVLLSRSGYTGEFGFEIFVDPSQLVRVWEAVLEAGASYGVIPCGLAARDSLRTGAVMPLSHQDIGPCPFINHPWPFALPYSTDETAFTKRFIGDRILKLRETAEHTHPFVGYDPRKVSVHDPAVVLDSDGEQIGVVLTCVADMAIGRVGDRIYSIASPDKPEGFQPRGLCCGFVRVKSRLSQGQEVELSDNRRKIRVVIVDDIRPHRTARRLIDEMMYDTNSYGDGRHNET
ncbi:MAG: aminomethyl transferase family protein [Desulfomonile tiedjei]|uniref:Aminomethyl transferase family protein n=1 Tax=Desulfomonile tiedjei TaxID=2358 RepID=A0A9D6Z5D5_9BACT|nr:aminomethyl transferase family protein [Desulfomonile tiedjei]